MFHHPHPPASALVHSSEKNHPDLLLYPLPLLCLHPPAAPALSATHNPLLCLHPPATPPLRATCNPLLCLHPPAAPALRATYNPLLCRGWAFPRCTAGALQVASGPDRRAVAGVQESCSRWAGGLYQVGRRVVGYLEIHYRAASAAKFIGEMDGATASSHDEG